MPRNIRIPRLHQTSKSPAIAFKPGDRVRLSWVRRAEKADGTVVSSNPLIVEMDHDHDEYEFELTDDGKHYDEINNHYDPLSITKIVAHCGIMATPRESLTQKVKPGDKVIFHVGDMSSDYRDWGFESEAEMAPVHAHDGQTATVDVVAIDDGDPASKIIDGPFYVDITFDDGFELSAVDGYNLTLVPSQQQLGRSGQPVGPGFSLPHEAPPSARFTKQGRRPVRHDFIPATGAESVEHQAEKLVKQVLENTRLRQLKNYRLRPETPGYKLRQDRKNGAKTAAVDKRLSKAVPQTYPMQHKFGVPHQ